MKQVAENQILRVRGAAATVCLVTVIYFRGLQVNPTTVAFSFLLAVLVISATWGSLRHLHRYSHYSGLQLFLHPPLLSLSIADPQNRVALLAMSRPPHTLAVVGY